MTSRKDKYALDARPWGIGGQAEVFKATDKKTKAVVALKRVIQNDEESIARLRHEIDVQRELNHPNVMPVLDFSSHYLWYTMPIADQTMEKLVTPIGDFDLLELLTDAARGLSEGHKRGFIHRDVTPSNIMQLTINGSTRWVVSDWGLVRRHGRTTVVRTAPAQLFGTAGFAAPELWDDAHTADARADVYSLGRVAAWAITGQWPKPNIPIVPDGTWRNLIRTTTALDPAQRPRSMEEVLDLLSKVEKSLKKQSKVAVSDGPEPIRITRVIAEEATAPRNDGTRESALYAVPFQLSRMPLAEWAALFRETWDHPPRFTTMHRPGIAQVRGDKIILNGTTIDEVERYHRETLLLVLERVNDVMNERERIKAREEERRKQEIDRHQETLKAVSERLRFDE